MGMTVTRAVGTPIQEAVLTAAAVGRPDDVLVSTASHETIVVLEQVEVGIGRPDIIILSVDLPTLTWRRAAGLRLSSLTEARTLGALLTDDPAAVGISRNHYQRLSARLIERGWLDGAAASRVIHDSVLIEAKVSHWGKGVHQLSRVRWASHAAALLVPDDVATQVSQAMLSHNRLGLLSETDGRLAWRRMPPREPLPTHLDAWLCELAIRALTC